MQKNCPSKIKLRQIKDLHGRGSRTHAETVKVRSLARKSPAGAGPSRDNRGTAQRRRAARRCCPVHPTPRIRRGGSGFTAEWLAGWFRAAFDVGPPALHASPDAVLCALDASPDVVPVCRFAERQSLRSEGWEVCSAPGPQLWIPLAPWVEPPKPTWRVPERQKTFDGTECLCQF